MLRIYSPGKAGWPRLSRSSTCAGKGANLALGVWRVADGLSIRRQRQQRGFAEFLGHQRAMTAPQPAKMDGSVSAARSAAWPTAACRLRPDARSGGTSPTSAMSLPW